MWGGVEDRGGEEGRLADGGKARPSAADQAESRGIQASSWPRLPAHRALGLRGDSQRRRGEGYHVLMHGFKV